jgi:hypothetical protein
VLYHLSYPAKWSGGSYLSVGPKQGLRQ